MKRIVLHFDGTWNKPADERLPPGERVETNVIRFHDSVAARGPDGIEQIRWYDKGVGAHWYDRFVGGALGTGLEINILEGYEFLARNYAPGDEVYVLGFSRGAFTARSLVGLVRNCGLVTGSFVGQKAAIAYGIYRTRGDGPDSKTARAFRAQCSRDVRIHFLGVWDTVGVLGIPLNVLAGFNADFYQFHDTKLSGIVDRAYHAIALDEHRKDYDVCLWDPTEETTQTLEQRWFVGAHSDVGGGYSDRQLSDITLRWMQEKAIEAGLGLTTVDVLPENCRGVCTDSYAEFLDGLYARLNPRRLRKVLTTRFGCETIDPSIGQRRECDPTYRPPNLGL